MVTDYERYEYDRGGKFMNYATFESHLCGTFKSQLCVPQDEFDDLGDFLLPNSSYSISWNELELDSDGEIRLVVDFDKNPVSSSLILSNNNGALDSDYEIRLVSVFDRNLISQTLILNDYGGDGTAEENAREELKGDKFPTELSKKVRESDHRSLDGFKRKPVSLILINNGGDVTVEEKYREEKISPTFILNNNGGDGIVEENTREEAVKETKFPLGMSKKVCKSSPRHFGGRRLEWQNFHPVVPNFPDSPISGSKLALDSDGEIWSLDDFERDPVSPTFVLDNNCGDGTVEEDSWEEKVSQSLIFNNNGGDRTFQENYREEGKGSKFFLGVSKKICKSNHPNFGCRRPKWGKLHRTPPNSPVSPPLWSDSDLGGEIRLWDDFDGNPVCTTSFLSDNGKNGTVEENIRDDEAEERKHPPYFSEKAPESNHRSLAGQRQQLSPARRCIHCQSEKTPQWRVGPMGPKTLCNACGVRYRSGRLLPEYRPAASPTFDSLKHSNFHRKIARILVRNQTQRC